MSRPEPPPREPCENEDCDLCHPLPRWNVSTVTVRRIKHSRNIKAATLEEALAIYDQGTAWPAGYDEHDLETLEENPVVVEFAPSNAANADRLYICYNRPGADKDRAEFLARGSDEFSDG